MVHCRRIASLNYSMGCPREWRCWHSKVCWVFFYSVYENSWPSLDRLISDNVHGAYKADSAQVVNYMFWMFRPACVSRLILNDQVSTHARYLPSMWEREPETWPGTQRFYAVPSSTRYVLRKTLATIIWRSRLPVKALLWGITLICLFSGSGFAENRAEKLGRIV